MPKIANLSADLVANTTKFEADLKKADRVLAQSQRQWSTSLARIDRDFQGVGTSIGGLRDGLFALRGAFPVIAAIAGGAALAKLTAEARRAIDAVGSLGEAASQVGVSTDALQAFRFAGSQVALSADEMDAALQRLTRTAGDAAQGNKSALDAFNALGVGVLDAAGRVRQGDDLIRAIADSLMKIQDPARRASLLVDIFGKSGQKLAPLMEGGAAGIDKLIARAKELGIVFDADMIQRADKVSDAIAAMEQRLGALRDKALLLIAVPVAEWLDEFVKRQSDFAHGLLGPDGLGAIEKLQSKLDELTGKRANLAAEVDNQFIGGMAAEAVAKLDAEIADIERRMAAIKGEQGQRFGRGEVMPIAGTNPPAKSTGTGPARKSEAELRAEALKRALADVQLQIDTFDMTPAEKAIAEGLAGVDVTAAGVADLALQFATATRLLFEMKDAAGLADDALAEIGRADAAGLAEWQARMAEGRQIMLAVRTPAEAYADELERINGLLSDGAIDHETYARKVATLDDELAKATQGSTMFRDAASEAMGTFQAGIVDALFEVDNLNDGISAMLRNIAKMLANKALGQFFDFGLNKLFGEAATGGIRGGLTLVGERGPELVDLPAGSYVSPAMRSAAMLRPMISSKDVGPGGVTVINNVKVEGSAGTQAQNADLARQIGAEVERAATRAVDERIGHHQRNGGMFNPGLGFGGAR